MYLQFGLCSSGELEIHWWHVVRSVPAPYSPRPLILSCALCATQDMMSLITEAGSVLAAHDTDGDRQLCFQEFTSFMSQFMAAAGFQLHEVLNELITLAQTKVWGLGWSVLLIHIHLDALWQGQGPEGPSCSQLLHCACAGNSTEHDPIVASGQALTFRVRIMRHGLLLVLHLRQPGLQSVTTTSRVLCAACPSCCCSLTVRSCRRCWMLHSHRYSACCQTASGNAAVSGRSRCLQ